MPGRVVLPTPPADSSTALAVGLVCGAVYVVVSSLGAVLFGGDFSTGAVGALVPLGVVVVVVPIALWLRFRLLTPVVLAGAAIGFWQIVVPLLGNAGDGTPTFAVSLGMIPLYTVGYALFAVVELAVRRTSG